MVWNINFGMTPNVVEVAISAGAKPTDRSTKKTAAYDSCMGYVLESRGVQ